MTLVFDKAIADLDKPRMHALILGIGRFPHLDNSPAGDRPACPDSARAVIEFLTTHQDVFESPLATIDCLLSDPRNAAGQDRLAQTDEIYDPRPDDLVDEGTRKNVIDICEKWMDRARKNDVLFLYCCSHGLAGVDERGLLVCEDYNSRPNNKPGFLLNVGSLAKALPAAKQAGSVWIFMDACQEVISDLIEIEGGVGGIQPARATIREQTSWPIRSVSIVAAQLNNVAYAPAVGGVAYFTETLLHGLNNCCVESQSGQWFVTSRQVENTLVQLAWVLNARTISTSRLSDPQPDHKLIPIDTPTVPVAVTTKPERLMTSAAQVEIKPRRQNAPPITTKQNGDSTWRFELPLNERQLRICFSYPAENNRLLDFELDPPSVHVRVE